MAKIIDFNEGKKENERIRFMEALKELDFSDEDSKELEKIFYDKKLNKNCDMKIDNISSEALLKFCVLMDMMVYNEKNITGK